MFLSQEERQQINAVVARFEAETGVQAIAAFTSRADAYPEVPWKAYAMGSALGALAISLDPLYVSSWTGAGTLGVDALVVLGSGSALAMMAALVPAIGRFFVDRLRAQTEAVQYAQTVFLEREVFRTASRRAVLLVMCRFERIAVVLADTGLAPYATPAALNDIGRAAGALLRRDQAVAACELALERVSALLEARHRDAGASRVNELADDPVEERR